VGEQSRSIENSTAASGSATTAVTPVARSLEEAVPGSMMFVNDRGDVISSRRVRWQMAAAGFYHAAIGALLVGFGVSLFGWAGSAAGSAYLAFGLWNLRERLRAARAARLIAIDPSRAETQLAALARGRWRVSRVRAYAYFGLAHVAMRRGDAAAALEHYRTAIVYYAKSDDEAGVHAQFARHGQVIALVNLDRVADARAALAALGPLPSGNALRIHRWMSELYVCFGEGFHALGPDDLHERSREALRLSSAGMLVALCAWAHAQRGDHDQARHLVAEVGERADLAQLPLVCPKLHAWMTAYAGR
jgi:tetratricopeptide (TPR) repeat protein